MERNREKDMFVKVIVLIVRFYQSVFSPVLGRNCRFYPSCSNYFIEAVERFGPLPGSILFLKRIIRCHPFNQGGYDPLPERTNK